jgi:hypothetical protein
VVVDPAIQNAAEDALQSGAELNLDFGAQRGALKALVPLYMEPDAGWYRVAAVASRISVIVILNPDNGPGTSPSADYMESIEELREAGVTVLGYVSTDYGAIAADKIHGEIDMYKHFGIHGIFFDQVSSQPEDLEYYRALGNYVRTSLEGSVFLNPGTRTDEEYIEGEIGDTTSIFEGPWSSWLGYEPDTYLGLYDSQRFASLVYAVPSAREMRSCVDLALSRGIGCFYVTDRDHPNPWSELPAFWDEEVDYLTELKLQIEKNPYGGQRS